jgi:hypothetical protein
MTRQTINNLIAQANRRKFITKVGMAGATIGVMAATSATPVFAQTSTPSDIDILNFALNLEYLEAEFYTYATTGGGIDTAGISITGTGTTGTTTGGSKVNFTDTQVQNVALELAADEKTHVTLLQNTITSLGGTPIAKPPINLVALGIGFNSMNEFLTLARAFEDIGVTAYGGAAPLITNKTVVGYAARILATEALHSGNIRAQIARLGISVTPLDGADHVPPPAGNMYFPTDSNAITEVRTPGQVLAIAFGGGTSLTSGGFFPAGVNGPLNTASTSTATTDGASLTSVPTNPIPKTGVATISWNAPSAQIIEIHVGSPSGPLFTRNINKGSMTTGPWITEGTTLYLQDVSSGKPLIGSNTLATLLLHVATS